MNNDLVLDTADRKTSRFKSIKSSDSALVIIKSSIIGIFFKKLCRTPPITINFKKNEFPGIINITIR